MLPIFGHLRVRNLEPGVQSTQFEEIERLCDSRDIEILERFSDSMSGTKLKERPARMEMIEKDEDLRPGCVVATELDRISRYTLQNPAAFHPF